jgi:hypothetical protein
MTRPIEPRALLRVLVAYALPLPVLWACGSDDGTMSGSRTTKPKTCDRTRPARTWSAPRPIAPFGANRGGKGAAR